MLQYLFLFHLWIWRALQSGSFLQAGLPNIFLAKSTNPRWFVASMDEGSKVRTKHRWSENERLALCLFMVWWIFRVMIEYWPDWRNYTQTASVISQQSSMPCSKMFLPPKGSVLACQIGLSERNGAVCLVALTAVSDGSILWTTWPCLMRKGGTHIAETK